MTDRSFRILLFVFGVILSVLAIYLYLSALPIASKNEVAARELAGYAILLGLMAITSFVFCLVHKNTSSAIGQKC